MKFKNGVYVQVFSIIDGTPVKIVPSDEINIAMHEADRIHKEMTGIEVFITAILDGTHMKGSKHYDGNAFDIRRWYVGGRVKEFISRLKNALGPNYDILNEKTHIHIEYDPK